MRQTGMESELVMLKRTAADTGEGRLPAYLGRPYRGPSLGVVRIARLGRGRVLVLGDSRRRLR